MVELIGILALLSTLKRIARERGVSTWWAALGPALWVFGEALGIGIGAAFRLEGTQAYGVGLTYALIGAMVAVIVVTNVPSGAGQS